MPDRPDITTEADIRAVVDAFYGDITDDPVLGAFFERLDFDAHRDKMVAFWSSVVFQTGTYRGRPFDAHLDLGPLRPAHFSRWIARFEDTVDRLYEGPTATRMKERAWQIATIFQVKMHLEPEAGLAARTS